MVWQYDENKQLKMIQASPWRDRCDLHRSAERRRGAGRRRRRHGHDDRADAEIERGCDNVEQPLPRRPARRTGWPRVGAGGRGFLSAGGPVVRQSGGSLVRTPAPARIPILKSPDSFAADAHRRTLRTPVFTDLTRRGSVIDPLLQRTSRLWRSPRCPDPPRRRSLLRLPSSPRSVSSDAHCAVTNPSPRHVQAAAEIAARR